MLSKKLEEKSYVKNSKLLKSPKKSDVIFILIGIFIYVAVSVLIEFCFYVSQRREVPEYTFSPSAETEYMPLGSFAIEYEKNGEAFTKEIFCEYAAAEPEQTVYGVGLFKGIYAALKHQYSIRLKTGEQEAYINGIKMVVNSEDSKYKGEVFKFYTLPEDFGTEVFAVNAVKELFGEVDDYTILEWKLN